MPNHVTNRIEIINLRSDDLGFKKYMNKERSKAVPGTFTHDFDFEKVVPIPEDVLKADKQYNDDLDAKYPSLNRIGALSDILYEWCLKNWNTKWNAYYMSLEDKNDMEFSTAWSHCQNVIMEMSRQNPYWIVRVTYYDEDLGYNLGMYYLNNGIVIDNYTPEDGSIDAYSFLKIHIDTDIREMYDEEYPNGVPDNEDKEYYLRGINRLPFTHYHYYDQRVEYENLQRQLNIQTKLRQENPINPVFYYSE